MKSDIITIDNQGNGFADAVAETKKVAGFTGLNERETIRLTMLTHEMLSLVRSVTGEMQASFWIEQTGRDFELNLTTETVMDKEKRYLLISSASSRKNEEANSFLGKLRDSFEKAMAADPQPRNAEGIPEELVLDLATRVVDDPEWDGYERSVLRKLADNVKIGIRGNKVHMTVSKRFAE